MSNPIPFEAIVIDVVHGGKDKDKLKGCYFMPTNTPGLYDFYDKTDRILAAGVSQTNTFTFHLEGHHWTVTGRDFLISNTAAFGDWTNDHKPKKDFPDDGEGESGSFQAQSGGSLPAEDAASSATA